MSRGDSDNTGLLLLGILAFAIAIVVIIWLAKLAVVFGMLLVLGSLVVLVLGRNSDDGVKLAAIMFIIGIVLFIAGSVTLNFFYHEPLGQAAVNSSTDVLSVLDDGFRGLTSGF